ncbi:NUDIX domain-containing protein [Arthrobacter sp. KK5.5]|uniref:NUDIX domain-containing protein n=1 Tax=Arthrobacter sp. KK5.5 TaxID=3373084 RepID=UPI003EE7F0AA
MAGLQALDGFLSARWRHRVAAHVLLRRRDGAVLLIRTPDGWSLPGGAVRADESPRETVGAGLRRLALEATVGRLLAQDFRRADGGGSENLLYDGGSWATDADGFTADGGTLTARFMGPDGLGEWLGSDQAALAAAGLSALELGSVAELEDGREATPASAPGNIVPPRALMPSLPETSPVLSAR